MIVLKSVKAAASVSSDMPTPIETIASVIGSAIATAVPSTISSTMIAAAKPSVSLVCESTAFAPITVPPNSTWTVAVPDGGADVVLDRPRSARSSSS